LSDLTAEERALQEQDGWQNPEKEIVEGLPAEPQDSPLAVVCIGSSAGGLEAMEEFFGHVPKRAA
jgi:chemotaxis response regulator CheB